MKNLTYNLNLVRFFLLFHETRTIAAVKMFLRTAGSMKKRIRKKKEANHSGSINTGMAS